MKIILDLDGVILDIKDLKERFPNATNDELYNGLTREAKPIQETVDFIKSNPNHNFYILSARYRKEQPTYKYVKEFLTKYDILPYITDTQLVRRGRQKNLWLEYWKADVFIDDKQEYLDMVTYPRVQKYLYNSQFKFSMIGG